MGADDPGLRQGSDSICIPPLYPNRPARHRQRRLPCPHPTRPRRKILRTLWTRATHAGRGAGDPRQSTQPPARIDPPFLRGGERRDAAHGNARRNRRSSAETDGDQRSRHQDLADSRRGDGARPAQLRRLGASSPRRLPSNGRPRLIASETRARNALAQLMVALDATVMNIALPSVQGALHFRMRTANGSSPPIRSPSAGLLLLGGRVADTIGRKPAFLIGLAGFAAASALAG